MGTKNGRQVMGGRRTKGGDRLTVTK
ncbi:hypothetical protein [Salmonella enterica]